MIEDDATDSQLIKDALDASSIGFDVRREATLESGVKALHSDDQPDVVLLDLNLPDSPSATVSVSRVKEAKSVKTAIVVVSGFLEPERVRELILGNVSACVPKNNLAHLGQTIMTTLSLHNACLTLDKVTNKFACFDPVL